MGGLSVSTMWLTEKKTVTMVGRNRLCFVLVYSTLLRPEYKVFLYSILLPYGEVQ